jgi:propanol-preferring alcohol dehydrogenase
MLERRGQLTVISGPQPETETKERAMAESAVLQESTSPQTYDGKTTGKVAVVHEFKGPLTIEERPIPAPEEDQVLVRIEASGLCHTDIHAAHGDWPVKPTLPLVPGHEGVGRVLALGRGVHGDIAEGDRVAIPWLGYACGECRYCNDGRETLCERQLDSGYSCDGAYGEFATAFARHVVKVPDGVDSLAAAPLTCAGVTTYKAVKVSGARPSMLAVVFGVGGLGHMAVQYAQIAGCTVVAVDIHDDKLAFAKQLGATYTVNALEQDPIEEIKKLGGADVAIATAVSPLAFEQAFASMARGGTLVFVGLPADNFVKLPIFETVLQGITIRGSIVGTHHDLEEVFRLHELGRTRVLYETRRLEEVNEAFKEVEEGTAGTTRLVFEF